MQNYAVKCGIGVGDASMTQFSCLSDVFLFGPNWDPNKNTI